MIDNGALIDIEYYQEKAKKYTMDSLKQEIDDYISNFDKTNNYELNNFSVCLSGENYEYKYNVKDNTLYDIASITKFFTLISIYNLYKENRIDLNKNINEYLNELKDLKDYTVLDAVKMKGIIETSAKLSDTKTNDEFNNLLKTASVKSYDEKDSCYTDIGHIILGKLIEKITNKTLGEYYKEVIFDKYNMPNTMFNPSRNYTLIGNGNHEYLPHDFKTRIANGYTGAAGLFSNANDLTNLAKAISSGKVFDEHFLNDIFNYGFIDTKNRNRTYSGLYKYTSDYDCYVPKEFTKYSLAHQGFTGQLIVSDTYSKMTQVILLNSLKDGAKLKHPDFLKGFYEFHKKINEYSLLLYIVSNRA